MELEQLLKPTDESTLIAAFLQGLREELRTAAQLLSMSAVDAFILDDGVQHERNSMLVASASREQHVSAFPADVTQSPSSENVVHNTIVAQLSTLAAQMKSLANSVAAMVASSSRPTSACEHSHLTSSSY
jgi:tetraacyldisaccharide-1-P 4'-kinase